MTEELIREARAFAALGSDLNSVEANRLIFELADELAAAGAAPQEPGDLSIVNGWLVESVGRHTCGAGMDGYGHEPGCGYEPVLNLAELDGYPPEVDEAKLASLLQEHRPSQWGSFDNDTIVYRCCGQDFGRLTGKPRKADRDPRELWEEHMASKLAEWLRGGGQ